MADTYTTAIRARKIEPGTQSDAHGTLLNEDVFDLFDHAIAGTEAIDLGSSTTYSLDALADGEASESRAFRLSFTGTPASAVTVTVPASVTTKAYVVQNASGQTLTIKYAATSGVAIANGNRQVVFADGTDVWPVTLAVSSAGSLSTLTVTGALTLNGALTTDNTTADEVGFKGKPPNSQTGNYTLVLSDAGKSVIKTGTSTATWTIPPNSSVAFPTGTEIALVNFGSSNSISVARGAGVSLFLAGDTGYTDANRSIGLAGMATLYKAATDSWLIISEAGVS